MNMNQLKYTNKQKDTNQQKYINQRKNVNNRKYANKRMYTDKLYVGLSTEIMCSFIDTLTCLLSENHYLRLNQKVCFKSNN